MILLINTIYIYSFVFFIRCGGDNISLKNIPMVVYVQGAMILASIYIVHSTAYSIQNSEGLPVENQLASWVILGKYIVFFGT